MFPTLSVTLIGLLVGAAMMLATRAGWISILAALGGAWIGFGVGALLGVAIDAALATGIWVAVGGHVLALVGAALAVRVLADRRKIIDRAGASPTGSR